MKTIVCAIQKGGQGKSMLATHLAFLAAEQGRAVLAVDIDGQGTLTRNLSESPPERDRSPALSLFNGKPAVPAPITLPFKVAGSLAVFTGDRRLVEVDETPKIQPGALRTALQSFGGAYDLCVIDPPPTLGKRLRAALMAADFVVMPFAPARESVDGLGDLLETIEQVKQVHNPGLHVVGLLPNKVNSRSKDEQRIIADIRAAAPDMLLPMTLHERTSVSGAMAASRPVWHRSGGGSQRLAAAEVRAACAHIIKIMFKE